MLDFGWSELFLILVLGVVLIGPRDIPGLVYQAGRLVRRLQYLRFALSKQFDDFMEQNDLNELRRGGGMGDLKGDVRQALTLPPQNAKPEPFEDEDEEVSFHHSRNQGSMEQITLPLQGGEQKEGNQRK